MAGMKPQLCLVSTLLAWALSSQAHAYELLTPEMVTKLVPAESNLWFEAERAENVLKEQGRTIENAPLQAYVQQVMDGLYPEWKGILRVQVIDDPVYNAFAMPNGAVYIHSGLLARLENEAQLATVLSHEAGHVIYRHGYRLRNSADGLAVVTGLVTVINPLVGLLGVFTQTAGLYGFSRDNEREADRVAFQRLSQNGYDLREATRTFQMLAEEALAVKDTNPPPYVFATHPKLEEREDSFKALLVAKNAQGGELGRERFEQATRGLRQTQLKNDFQAARYTQLITAMSKVENRSRYGIEADFYLAEAYRLRKQSGDSGLARSSYSEVLKQQPQHIGAMRGLANLSYREGKLDEASSLLESILQTTPLSEADAGFARQLLNKVNTKRNPDAVATVASATPQEEKK